MIKRFAKPFNAPPGTKGKKDKKKQPGPHKIRPREWENTYHNDEGTQTMLTSLPATFIPAPGGYQGRVASNELEDLFEERTKKHLDLVQKYIDRLKKHYSYDFKDEHDKSKFEEPEHEPYLYITRKHKAKSEGEDYEVPDEWKDKCDEATFHHVKNNKHHPEYWDDSLTENPLNKEDRDKSDKLVDATKMPKEHVLEMVADWCAMSEELGTNTPKEWADDNIGKRWKFTPEQKDWIYEAIDKVWDKKTTARIFGFCKFAGPEERKQFVLNKYFKDYLPEEAGLSKASRFAQAEPQEGQWFRFKYSPEDFGIFTGRTREKRGVKYLQLWTNPTTPDQHGVVQYDTLRMMRYVPQDQLVRMESYPGPSKPGNPSNSSGGWGGGNVLAFCKKAQYSSETAHEWYGALRDIDEGGKMVDMASKLPTLWQELLVEAYKEGGDALVNLMQEKQPKMTFVIPFDKKKTDYINGSFEDEPFMLTLYVGPNVIKRILEGDLEKLEYINQVVMHEYKHFMDVFTKTRDWKKRVENERVSRMHDIQDLRERRMTTQDPEAFADESYVRLADETSAIASELGLATRQMKEQGYPLEEVLKVVPERFMRMRRWKGSPWFDETSKRFVQEAYNNDEISPGTIQEQTKKHPWWKRMLDKLRRKSSIRGFTKKARTLTIGLDIDGVIGDFHQMLLNLAEKHVDIPEEEKSKYKLKDMEGVSSEVQDKVFDEAFSERQLVNIPIVSGAVETVNKWHDAGHKIIILTARTEHWKDQTEDWLDKIGIKYDKLIFDDNKGEVAAKEGIDFFLDDKPENVAEMHAHDIDAYLFSQPWNEDSDLPRIDGWGHFKAAYLRPEIKERLFKKIKEHPDPQQQKEYRKVVRHMDEWVNEASEADVTRIEREVDTAVQDVARKRERAEQEAQYAFQTALNEQKEFLDERVKRLIDAWKNVAVSEYSEEEQRRLEFINTLEYRADVFWRKATQNITTIEELEAFREPLRNQIIDFLNDARQALVVYRTAQKTNAEEQADIIGLEIIDRTTGELPEDAVVFSLTGSEMWAHFERYGTLGYKPENVVVVEHKASTYKKMLDENFLLGEPVDPESNIIRGKGQDVIANWSSYTNKPFPHFIDWDGIGGLLTTGVDPVVDALTRVPPDQLSNLKRLDITLWAKGRPKSWGQQFAAIYGEEYVKAEAQQWQADNEDKQEKPQARILQALLPRYINEKLSKTSIEVVVMQEATEAYVGKGGGKDKSMFMAVFEVRPRTTRAQLKSFTKRAQYQFTHAWCGKDYGEAEAEVAGFHGMCPGCREVMMADIPEDPPGYKDPSDPDIVASLSKFSAPRWTTNEKNRLKELYLKYRARGVPHHIIYKAAAHLLGKSFLAVKQKLERMYDIDEDLGVMKYEHWDQSKIDQAIRDLYLSGQPISRMSLPANLMYQITNHSMPKAETCGFPAYYDSFDHAMASNILAVGLEREGDILTENAIETIEDALKYYRRKEKMAHAWNKDEIIALLQDAHVAGLPLTYSFFKKHPDIYKPLIGVGRSLEGLKDSIKRCGHDWSDLVIEAAPEYVNFYTEDGRLKSSTEELRIRRFLELNEIPFRTAEMSDKIAVTDPELIEQGYKNFVPDFFILNDDGSTCAIVEVFGSVADSLAANTSELYREKKTAKEKFYQTLPYSFIAINNNADGIDLTDEILREKFSAFMRL